MIALKWTVKLTILELCIVVFQISFGTLTSCSDRMRVVLIEDTSRREFEKMRPSLLLEQQRRHEMSGSASHVKQSSVSNTYVFSDDQEPNSVWTFSIVLRVGLSTVRDALYDPSDWNRSSVKHSRLHRLLPHEVAEQ